VAIRHCEGLPVCAPLSANKVERYVTVRKLLVTIFDTLVVFISWETQAHWVNTSVRSACDITAAGHSARRTNTHREMWREKWEKREKIYETCYS